MHRNTYLLVVFLAVFAALVVGVNWGKRIASQPTPTPVSTPSATIAPTQTNKIFTSDRCGFSLVYPSTMIYADSATNSALLIHEEDRNQSVAISCQEEIPRPPLPADRIETLVLYNETKTASVAARLYHDASAKDGVPLDELIFRNPKTGMDIFIAGFGEAFDAIIQTVKLLP